PRPPATLLSFADDLVVTFGAAVAVELPDVTHLANLVEVQISDHQLVVVARRLRDDLAARVAEVALSVKLADVPGLLMADAIDGADEKAIGHGMRRLLKLPQVFRQPRNRRRGIEDNLRAIQ